MPAAHMMLIMVMPTMKAKKRLSRTTMVSNNPAASSSRSSGLNAVSRNRLIAQTARTA